MSPGPGALRSCREARRFVRDGFTLLELCIVLCLIALMLGLSIPAVDSAFAEQAIRSDSQELDLMVKTAMLQSNNQKRNYVLDLSSSSMSLHPEAVADTDAPAPAASDSASVPEDIVMTAKLEGANQLWLPDVEKAKTWIAMPATSWTFRPGELCPLPRLRISRGEAWIEVSFNPLTGNVEDEGAYLP